MLALIWVWILSNNVRLRVFVIKMVKFKELKLVKVQLIAQKLGIVVAGHTGVLADMAGFRMPVEAVALQALVSEPIKPCMDVVVMANTVHGYMSQSIREKWLLEVVQMDLIIIPKEALFTM